MGILAWIIFGALAGWIASLLMKTDANQGTLTDIVLGIIGSVVGSYVLGLFGNAGVTGFNLYSIGVAVLGAAIVIYVGRLLRK